MFSKKYPDSWNYLFKFDDVEGKYRKIINFYLSISNVKNTETICLLISIYFKINEIKINIIIY